MNSTRLNISIREFCPGDEPALWEVFHSAIHHLAAADYSQEQISAWAPDAPDLEKWATRMQGLAPFVAECDGRIVGYADVQADGYVDHLFVSPIVARSGVGSLLMKKIHETALLRRTRSLFANVSLTAGPFFVKWGFTVEAQQNVTIRGVNLINFRMRKRLIP